MSQEFEEKEELFEEEEFLGKPIAELNTIERLQYNFEKYNKAVIIVSLIIIVGSLALWYMGQNIEEGNLLDKQSSSLALSRILPYYNSNDYQKALKGDSLKTIREQEIIGLEQIVTKYDGTASAEVAALYAGNCYLKLDDFDNARKYLEIAKGSESIDILVGVNAGLALCEETAGNLKGAVGYYEKAAELSKTPEIKGRYQFFAAYCSELSKDFEKAEKLYREIVNQNKSDFVGDAKTGITRLGMIIE